jgi:hypothetical protein
MMGKVMTERVRKIVSKHETRGVLETGRPELRTHMQTRTRLQPALAREALLQLPSPRPVRSALISSEQTRDAG